MLPWLDPAEITHSASLVPGSRRWDWAIIQHTGFWDEVAIVSAKAASSLSPVEKLLKSSVRLIHTVCGCSSR